MTKKAKKWVKYSTTILVLIVMFISSMPYSVLKVFADELKSVGETNTTANTFVQPDKIESTNIDDKSLLDNAYILDENVENRTLNSKEFVMSDGSVIVQNFAQNVHYLEDGDFKEIDNTLVEVKDENGKSAYENTANFYKVKISKDFEPNNSLIKIDNGEHGLDFSYIEGSLKNVVAQKKSGNTARTQNQYKGKKLKAPEKFSTGEGKISYNNISEDIDLEYEVKDNGIKENILVKDYLADYDFDFKVKTSNLFLQKIEDGSIIALDSVGNVKYVIPAPFMFDANGEYNYDVEYILNKKGNEYYLTISADEDWIEKEAKLPVTIDPIVEIKNNNSFSFVNVYEKGTGTQPSSEVYVGEKESGNKSNAYFRFSTSNTNKNYTLVSATVSFHIRTEGMGIFNWKNIKYSACIVDSEMPILNITYTNRPERLQYLGLFGADTNLAPTEGTNHLPIDLNAIDGKSVTLGLEREENNSVGAYVRVFVTGTSGIYLTCRYKQITGLDEAYSTESAEINGATAYVNKASHSLTLNCDVASINNSSTLPLQASLVYNTNYNDIFNELGVATMFGNNFKLNFQQFVRQGSDYIALYDSDGSITVLNYDSRSALYRSVDGKLTAMVASGKITIYDANKNKREFENGRLRQIYRGEATAGTTRLDRIVIDYLTENNAQTDKISEILFYTGGAGIETSKISLTYNNKKDDGYPKVISINTYYGERLFNTYSLLNSYSLRYDSNGNLIEITDGRSNYDVYNLNYDISNNLSSVFNKDYEGLYFTYLEQDNSVRRIDQVAGKNVNNARFFDYIEFDYTKHNSYVETKYYQNGKQVGSSYVCFDVLRNPISEWSKDEDGKVRGVNRGNYNFNYVASLDYYDYFKEDVSFEEKLNTTFEDCSLQAGGTATGSVNSASGITNNTYYRYGLTFYVECDSFMDLTVTFGSYSKRIVLKSGGKLYVTLPCGYVQTGTFTFKNNGSRVTSIYNVTYNVIDYVKETKTFNADGTNVENCSVAEIISYNRKGEYEQKLYDGFENLVTLNKRSIQDDVLETTTYTYNTLEYGKENQIESITTTRNGATTYSQVYTYYLNETTGEREDTIITTAGGLKKKSVEKVEFREEDDEEGAFVSISIDENNVSTERTYAILGGDVRLKTLKSGNYIQEYNYDGFGEVKLLTLTDLQENEILKLTKDDLNDRSNTYEFSGSTLAEFYNEWGLISEIQHNNVLAITYEYETNSAENKDKTYDNVLKKKTYANGNVEEYTYYRNNAESNAPSSTTVSYKNSATDTNADNYVYNYDSVNRLTSSSYTKNGTTLNYNYGDLSSTTKSELTIGGLTYGAKYTTNYNDVLGRVISSNDKFTLNNVDTTFNYTYGYNYRGQVTSNSVGTYNSNITHDSLERLNGYVAKNGNNTVINNTYVYDSYVGSDGVTYTTNRIKQITDNVRAQTTYSTYDENGYITSIQYNGITNQYTYDAIGRLASETINGQIIFYNYDVAPNGTNMGKNALTSVTGDNKNVNYTYDAYGRLLYITENNVSSYFEYDDMGNPVLYKGTSSSATDNMVWTQGRKLESGTLNGNNFAYAYDMNGMRYQKTVNGNVTEYYLDGTTIVAENRRVGETNNLIYYIYDMNGLSGMVYNGENYYYVKNTLGDIIAIRNSAGAEVASYSYDAWGNAIVKSGAMADINPFRYRGYYYDTETGFYYLQTRYYDPTTRLFINADNYELISTLAEIPGQLNMYGYCNNNPIMFTDESGLWIESVFDFFSLGLSIIEVVVNPLDPLAWAGLAGDAFDLIPFVTGVGESIKGVKIVKKGINEASYRTIKMTKAINYASDFADGGWDLARNVDRTVDGFTRSNHLLGTKIHKTFMNGQGIPGTRLRVDGLSKNAIFELKPYNRRNLRAGVKQLMKYNEAYSWVYDNLFLVFY